MNFIQTVDFLYNRLPNYQIQGSYAFNKNLNVINKLDNVLGNPHHNFKTIHVAGTNGKGSTCHMLASILQEAGYKVGLYTSPHLKSFTERIKINNKHVDEQFVVDFVRNLKFEIKELNPSFFEIITAMAFDYFSKQKVDIAIVEVGMGGRLDATNIIKPILSIITSIGLDHQQFLGNTLSEIAIEKFGIIKSNTPVVLGDSNIDIQNLCLEICNKQSAPIYFTNQIIDNFDSDLKGDYQIMNKKTVVQSINILIKNGLKIKKENVVNGFLNVVHNTGLKGRWQILQENPLIICDTAHNEDGVKYVVEQLKGLKCNNLYIVWGMVNDKDADKIISLLPKHAYYLITNPSIPRAKLKEDLAHIFKINKLNYEIVGDVSESIKIAKNKAEPSDCIFIGGSTFVVAEIDCI